MPEASLGGRAPSPDDTYSRCMRRATLCLILAGVPALILGCAGTTPAGSPGSTAAEDAERRQPVVVGLAVGWAPESGLTVEERGAQRQRIEAAQDEVLRSLGGHGSLSGRLTATAQMALSVDAEGRQILVRHPLVAAVDDDTAEPAGRD